MRRSLQERVRAGASDLQTVSRLFSIFSYEGSYEQASALLRDLEDRRAGRAPRRAGNTQPSQPSTVSASWNGRELETVAAMFTSIGDYDQASRYLYTLYLVGGLQSGSSSREDALYRLFTVMIDAAGTPTRVAAGDLSFYKDVAQVDQHPGFMNGVLSLILSGNDVTQEFATQEKAAAGYFNRAFAYRIFTSFKQEYAAIEIPGRDVSGRGQCFFIAWRASACNRSGPRVPAALSRFAALRGCLIAHRRLLRRIERPHERARGSRRLD